jgi:antitoxin component YwqK of YwqJK toxin-antitoxin module
MKLFSVSVILSLISILGFSQQDSAKVEKRLSHFPTKFDKEPGFYEAIEDWEDDEITQGADASFDDDANVGDYFGEFDEDTEEDHKKGEMYRDAGLDDPFAETDKIAIRDKKYTWFAEDSDIVIARSNYKNGRLSGRYRKWTDDGKQLITDMAYKKGKGQGKATLYYANGQVKSKTYYNKGKLNGSYVRYDGNGNKVREGFYVGGKAEGEQIQYHENGQIKSITNYKKGKKHGVRIEYDENGKETNRVNYIKGIKEGNSDGIKYKKTKKGKIYKFRINETDNDIKIEKERVK